MEDDQSDLAKSLQIPRDENDAESDDDVAGTDDPRSADSEAGRPELEVGNGASSKSTKSSRVKLIVTELESRCGSDDSAATQPPPPPSLQSCPRIAAIQDSLISQVQDPKVSKTSSPMTENSPKVLDILDSLVAQVQVPDVAKVLAPVVQSSPKIAALQETLISRVQDPGTSKAAEQNLGDCPSVASRQTAILDTVKHKDSSIKRHTTTTAFPKLRNYPFRYRRPPADGLPNSTDGPEIAGPKVGPSCGELYNHEEEPDDVPTNDQDGPESGRLEDGTSDIREMPEDTPDNCPDCSNLRDQPAGDLSNCREEPEVDLCAPESENVSSVRGDMSNDLRGPNNSSFTMTTTSV